MSDYHPHSTQRRRHPKNTSFVCRRFTELPLAGGDSGDDRWCQSYRFFFKCWRVSIAINPHGGHSRTSHPLAPSLAHPCISRYSIALTMCVKTVNRQPVRCPLARNNVRRPDKFSQKEQNSSVRRQPSTVCWLDMVRRLTARRIQ